LGNPDEKPLPSDPARFGEELRTALTYADEELEMVRVDTGTNGMRILRSNRARTRVSSFFLP